MEVGRHQRLWSDEKLFLVQQHLNKKNDRVLLPVLAPDHSLRIIRKRKNPAKVMVFGCVASDGRVMPPIIFPPSMTVNSINYQQVVLSKVKEWIRETWAPKTTIFMQNGALAHKSKSTVAYLEKNLGKDAFWRPNMWPPSSPDANLMDFVVWSKLVAAICKKEPKNHQHLIDRIEGMWMDILDHNFVVKSCSAAWETLCLYIYLFKRHRAFDIDIITFTYHPPESHLIASFRHISVYTQVRDMVV